MRLQPTKLLQFLLIFSLSANVLSSAYACSPPLGEKPTSIAEKTHNSSYVFSGVVTEITESYIKIKVHQYFKGAGQRVVKIAQIQDQNNTCVDQFVLEQHGLFFTKGDIDQRLEAVYDGAFGSALNMNTETFSQITTATECMATYQDGQLTVPCITLNGSQNMYQATLDSIRSSDGLQLSVSHASPAPKRQRTTQKCVATYKHGRLTIPCIAVTAPQRLFQAILEPTDSTDSLSFLASYVTPVTKIQHVTHFDMGETGTLPEHWREGITGEGQSNWKLEIDNTAPSSPLVLNQSADGDFPWCIYKESSLSDGFVSVQFKAISGSIDQAAGIIWRWKDANNYYVARANALEDNISIYYMKNGVRYAIRYVDLPKDLPVNQNMWHTLRVDFQGDHFVVSFAGKIIVDVIDSHIKGTGAVGLWTKEDSETSFDDFTYSD